MIKSQRKEKKEKKKEIKHSSANLGRETDTESVVEQKKNFSFQFFEDFQKKMFSEK